MPTRAECFAAVRIAAAAVRDEMLAEMNLPTVPAVDPWTPRGEASPVGAVAVETTPATVDLLVVAGVAGDSSGHDNKQKEVAS